jgi:hypothetical protein
MNSLEWAVRDGVPYAIDFMNPAPDMDIYSLTPFYFDWVVKHMADMAIRLAKHPRPQNRELRWDNFTDQRTQEGEDLTDATGRAESPVARGTGAMNCAPTFLEMCQSLREATAR